MGQLRTTFAFDSPEEELQWLTRQEALAGHRWVPVDDIFTADYVQKELQLADFDAMLEAAGFPVDLPTLADFTPEEDARWDEMIRSRSRFASWNEIFADAGQAWLHRKIAGEPIPPPNNPQRARAETQQLSREELNRIEQVFTAKDPPLPPAIDAEQEAFDVDRILYTQVDSWIQRGVAFQTTRTLPGLLQKVTLVIAYVRRGRSIETLLLEPDLGGLTYRVRRSLTGQVALSTAEDLYFRLLQAALSEGEGTLWERFLRFMSLGAVEKKSTLFDLGIDLFNAARGNDPEAIANSLEAIAKRYLPQGTGLDAILAGIEFLRVLPPEQVELALDFADLLLTIIGFIPGAGEPADAASTGLSAARGNYLDATLSATGMIPIVGLLASVPKLLLIINKIRRGLGKLNPGIARILSDLITTIQNLLSRWPENAKGGITEPIRSILTQLQQAFQDATGRLKRSKTKSDASQGTKQTSPTGDRELSHLDPNKCSRKRNSSEPTPDPSNAPDGTDLVRRNESSLDDATQASIKNGETPAGFEPVDNSWKNLVEGKAQKTETPGHQFRSYREAIRLAKSGEYEKVYLNRAYSTATGVTTTPRRLPDVIGVRKDGKIDVIEVPSKTDKDSILQERNEKAMSQLPPRTRSRPAGRCQAAWILAGIDGRMEGSVWPSMAA